MAVNRTYRNIEKRILNFREESGRDYDGVWISIESFHRLPETVRKEACGGRIGWVAEKPPRFFVHGVPVSVFEVLPPG